MASIKQRHNKFEARVRVPSELREAYGGKELLYKTLQAGDRRSAKIEAAAWEVLLRAEWQVRLSGNPPAASVRHLYNTIRRQALLADYGLVDLPDAHDAVEGGIQFAIDRMEDEIGGRDLSEAEEAKLLALQDARTELRGAKAPVRARMEPSFSEVAEEHLRLWKARDGLKETNTENQKRATLNLFALYFGDRPSRGDALPSVGASLRPNLRSDELGYGERLLQPLSLPRELPHPAMPMRCY